MASSPAAAADNSYQVRSQEKEKGKKKRRKKKGENKNWQVGCLEIRDTILFANQTYICQRGDNPSAWWLRGWGD